MQQIFALISSVIMAFGYILYIRQILAGKVKPHRTTRLVIFIVVVIASTSLLAQGSTITIWLFAASSLFCFILFLLSLKYGMGGWEPIDVISLMIAICGIVLWKATSNPTVAIVASVVADASGIIPTLIKTYRHPQTEDWRFWGITILAAGVNLISIQRWTPGEYLYPLYLVVINAVMVLLIVRPKIASKN